jgi:hypothetical protein
MFSETDIFEMLEFGGVCFNRRSAFNCTSLLADLFLYSYETYFLQRLLVTNEKKLSRAFTFRYMNVVLHDIIMSFC